MEGSKLYSHLKKFHTIKINEKEINLLISSEKLKIRNPTKSLKLNPSKITADLCKTLENRSSTRQLGTINLENLSTILYYSARVKDSFYTETNFLKTFRPYSSAGGRHSLELLCITSQVSGLEDGIWHFNPFQLELTQLNIPIQYSLNMLKKFEKLLDDKSPCVVIISLSILARTLSRYSNGLSLIWRDTGNLFATMAIVSEGLSLKTCQLGLSEDFQYSQELGFSLESVWITGGIAIGSSI